MPLRWRKSSHTHPNDCVELAWPPDAGAVRDSKNPGPILRFDTARLEALIAGLKSGAVG